MNQVLEEYEEHSLFARSNWDDPAFIEGKRKMTADTAVREILGQTRYILHDPLVSRGRKLLTIEQFRNTQMAAAQTKQNYEDVMAYFTGLVRFLIAEGKLTGGEPDIMAAQLCLPISVWINLCDREPEREGEILALIERHVRQFFERNGASAAE